jgi:flagellar assembly protein FliH
MQLLSSIIKNTIIKPEGKKTIITDFSLLVGKITEASHEVAADETVNEEENNKKTIEGYENIAKTIVENARRQSESILSKAYEEAQKMEQQAFAQGYEMGKEQGYKDAYEETFAKGTKEANRLIQNATNVLQSAKLEYENYFALKQEELLQLAVNMAESVLRKKLGGTEGLSEMLFEVLNNSRNSETYIIRVASKHVEELKDRVTGWKERLGLKGEVFILSDEEIQPGNAVIEKNSGKVVIGIDIGMESIRQALA